MGQDGRRNYGIGSFFQKKIMDPIKKVFKDPVKTAAAAYGAYTLGGGKYGIPGLGDREGFEFGKIIPRIGKLGSKAVEKTQEILSTPVGSKDEKNKERTIGSTLLSGILSPQALALGSGLLAGAFTKDEEDPLYTGQDVGLNLRDIAKLANITDPVAGQAIGLRFLPDVEARKFTPEQMAASFAANAPQDFTEQREFGDTGGIEPPMVAYRVASTRLAYDGHIHQCVSKQGLPVSQLGASSLCYRIQPPMGLYGCVCQAL